MAQGTSGRVIDKQIGRYIETLRENRISIWRLYLFGSYAKGRARAESDIDLAVFLDQDEIDGFDEDLQLLRLTRNVDLRIEPHSFSRRDFENPDPFVREIINTGERIL
ncbi:MAG TPA: nucleotidyltransferase domain-containing protein [Desulfurivibrio alkaliphilus]|uniref:Nucleotidyltransferase domain-containing protein n=1 Tax=Desulfurivibrio alkaliphilus TaxID=427923 RepID=A0A7C2TGC0_9BACT|nr:nucleotidyltransferase domain-containing protein [Desulfurivibrio alkaliphilus]